MYQCVCFTAVAGPVSSLTAVGQNEDTLIVTWGVPLQPNGTITQYTVSVVAYDGSVTIGMENVNVGDDLRRMFSNGLGEFSCTYIRFVTHFRYYS